MSQSGSISSRRTSSYTCCCPIGVVTDRSLKAIFLLLGIGTLIPWNAFVSAKPYFRARFCSEEGQDTINFELWFGFVWNLSAVLSLGSVIVYQTIRDRFVTTTTTTTTTATTTTATAVTNTTLEGNITTAINNDSISITDDMIPSDEPLNPENELCSISSSSSSSTSEARGSYYKVMISLALYLVVFLFTDLLVFIPAIPPSIFLTITLVGLIICGICSIFATAGIISTASLFPSNVGITPFFSGQAVGGVAVAAANFIAAILEDPSNFWEEQCEGGNEDFYYDVIIEQQQQQQQQEHNNIQRRQLFFTACTPYDSVDWVVFVYFFLGCITLVICLFGYSYIYRFQHRDNYEPIQDAVINIDHGPNDSPRIGLEINDRISERNNNNNNNNKSGVLRRHEESPCAVDELYNDPLSSESLPPPPPPPTAQDNDRSSANSAHQLEVLEGSNITAIVWSAVKGPAWCIFLTFTVSLALFPGWVSELRSSRECNTHWRIFNDLYTPFSFVLFNVGDLIGRILAGKVQVIQIHNMPIKLVLTSILRIIFFPLFLFCLVDGEDNNSSSSLGILKIQSDFYSLLVQLFFAITNGMLISLSFMYAPTCLGNDMKLHGRSSEILSLAISFGLLNGSFFSFPFAWIASRWG